MITQKAIYDKKTYQIREFIETSNGEITTHEKYDKIGRVIYKISPKLNDRYMIFKYHKDTTKKRHMMHYSNITNELIGELKFDKIGRVTYERIENHIQRIKYYKDTKHIRYTETNTEWVKIIYRNGIRRKRLDSVGNYTIYTTDEKGNLVGTNYDKDGESTGSSMNRIKTQTYTPYQQ